MSPLDPARITRNVVENQEDGRLGADAPTALAPPSGVKPASGLEQSRSSHGAEMRRRFLDFCRSKSADETYNYWDGDHCPVGQFIATLDGVDPETHERIFDRLHLGEHSVHGLSVKPWTFGDLVWRADTHAQAIEARRATTGTGVVHESAVPEGCAQTPEAQP